MEGQFLASVGTQGKGPLQFEFPVSVIVHPNGQVISEADSNRIQVLTHYNKVASDNRVEAKPVPCSATVTPEITCYLFS